MKNASDNIKKLTIVGGGSAGWMTALYLNKLYNSTEKNFEITVIESPDIGIIGVGEATVHSIRYFFQAMGLNEFDLLKETNATLKTGIMFRNWMKPHADGTMHEYFHPFESQLSGSFLDINSLWMLSGRHEFERFDEGVCLSTALAKNGHSPKSRQSRQYEGLVPYGYHIDAVLLARYLRKIAIENGVTHIEATVNDVEIQGQNIQAVLTENGDRFEADVFLDCTGFRALLISKLKQDNWQSFKEALPCTKAVALQRSMPDGESPRSYTVATALSNGWAWQIDLTNRQGTGYVYDGDRLSADQAEQELRDFLGAESDVIKSVHLDMRVGCLKEFWVGNCIAIGLSGGFIEPLESTGLHLINLSAGLLATHLDHGDTDQSVRDSFNRLMNGFYQDLKQFIVLHYCLTDREDTDFWRQAPATVNQTPWLKEQLQIWHHKICEYQDLAGSYSTVFTDENYRYVLYGMGHHPALKLSVDQGISKDVFDRVKNQSNRVLSNSVPHLDYLNQINL
ncbi:tryptophan 7-halogenase [Temperatibacter marinus]|uniref:Tryptophan 7-halogenase n=1 Tax=Temperatibacter marinus TaxID=1456591 RepID=A0AA52EKT5_9PROT|nr:tryptophan halogenase family protein [Temperatibacter marinus]WND04079.1 tryptophan 7-halogenase [Temperatibacter marinus]